MAYIIYVDNVGDYLACMYLSVHCLFPYHGIRRPWLSVVHFLGRGGIQLTTVGQYVTCNRHTFWSPLWWLDIFSAVINDGWWGGVWWNNQLDCFLLPSNIPETVLVWLYLWPNKSPCLWLVNAFDRCCHWQICLLWRFPSLLRWVVGSVPSLWAPCASLRLSDSWQKGLQVWLTLRWQGRFSWSCIWHDLVHWKAVAC